MSIGDVPSRLDLADTGNAGVVQTQYVTFAADEPMPLDCKASFGPVTLAYETYGRLDERRANAVLICHALSSDAHVAGWRTEAERDAFRRHAEEARSGRGAGGRRPGSSPKPGWWDMMVGPGKPFDTNKYFVICSNILGGCSGSTGPSSTNPATGEPYATDFPVITIADMVRAERHLLDALGIERLLSATGGSMGGFQAIQWTLDYPDRVRSVMAIATSARLSAQALSFNAVGRQAILSDPGWQGGRYYGTEGPQRGLALARMIGHITYLSDKSMHEKFGHRLQDQDAYSFGFDPEFQVESYLQYQGNSFTQRFDANTYVYITKAMDYFDPAAEHGSLLEAFARIRARYLVVSFSTDWLFPTYQAKEIVRALKGNGVPTAFSEIATDCGHDAFLLEREKLGRLIAGFLDSMYREVPSA